MAHAEEPMCQVLAEMLVVYPSSHTKACAAALSLAAIFVVPRPVKVSEDSSGSLLTKVT